MQMRSYAMHLYARKLSPFSRGGTTAGTAVTSFATHTHTGAFPWIRTLTTILVARKCDLACTVSSNTANGRKLGSHERAVLTSSMPRRPIHRSKGRPIKAPIRRLWPAVCQVTGTGVPFESKTRIMTFLTRDSSLQDASAWPGLGIAVTSVNGHAHWNPDLGLTASRHTHVGIPHKQQPFDRRPTQPTTAPHSPTHPSLPPTST